MDIIDKITPKVKDESNPYSTTDINLQNEFVKAFLAFMNQIKEDDLPPNTMPQFVQLIFDANFWTWQIETLQDLKINQSLLEKEYLGTCAQVR